MPEDDFGVKELEGISIKFRNDDEMGQKIVEVSVTISKKRLRIGTERIDIKPMSFI